MQTKTRLAFKFLRFKAGRLYRVQNITQEGVQKRIADLDIEYK